MALGGSLVSALVTGIMLGLAAGFAPGPLMALVITHALRHNVREGLLVAAAPLLTDAPIILAVLVVLNRVAEFERVLGILAAAGGLYVLYLSYETMRTGPLLVEVSEARPRSLGKGVLVNVLNPHPYLFWVTVGGPFILKAHQSGLLAPCLFVAGFYLSLVGSKVVIAVIAGKSRSFLAGRAYVGIMRTLGLALGVFAVLLLRHAFTLLV
jgi:threonine/homoserine/homoserine lactone efflux protein